MPVPAVFALDGVIRHYAWGSRTAIAELLGVAPDGAPAAELWFGAHPAGPSPLTDHGSTLDVALAGEPERLLGAASLDRFGARLPFMLKVLAVDTALSIQVHPTLEQAQAGFAAEQAAGVAPDAAGRNYRDANHKPELLCALSPVEALCGFRPVEDTLRLFDAWGLPALAAVRELLAGPDGLRAAVSSLLRLDDPAPVAAAVTAYAATVGVDDEWAGTALAVRLAAADFPGDIGVVLVLLLNHVHLEAGEAIYLGVGTVHCYLRGTAVEIMANSDNVLRCGLTPKHVDVPELLKITDFSPLVEPRCRAREDGFRLSFESPAPDFALSVIDVDAHERSRAVGGQGPYIVLCTEGEVRVEALGASVELVPGRAAFVAAREGDYTVRGTGRVYVATVGG